MTIDASPVGGLRVEALLAAAEQQTGLHDYGDERMLEGLERYIRAVNEEADLAPEGHAAVFGDTCQLLTNRLRLEEDFKKHPEIADEVIVAPVIVTGLMRTGTTKLQRLLAADPGVQKLPYWRIANPAPFPGSTGPGPDPRIAVAEEMMRLAMQYAPDTYAAHPFQPNEPDEDVIAQRMSFEAQTNGCFDHVPSYREWLQTRPPHHPYGYLRRILQYAQWQDGGSRDRPWVLKSPLHLGNVSTLLDLFPDAVIVHCHRDVMVTLASTLRMYELVWQSRGSNFQLRDVAPLFDHWAGEMAKYLDQRQRAEVRDRIIDVQYEDIRSDPCSVVKTIYRAWGRDVTPDLEQRVLRWHGENPQNQFGRNEYSLERYGVAEDRVGECFRLYQDQFGNAKDLERLT